MKEVPPICWLRTLLNLFHLVLYDFHYSAVDVQSNPIDHPIPCLCQTVVIWFTLIMMSIIAGTRPASTTHWIWWGCPAVILEIVQAASCEEKDGVYMEITEVHTGFCRHLMLIDCPFFSYVHRVTEKVWKIFRKHRNYLTCAYVKGYACK